MNEVDAVKVASHGKCITRSERGWLFFVILTVIGIGFQERLSAATPPQFYRGINLNGEAVRIDDNAWQGQDSPHYQCRDKAFENQTVKLVPATDPERAKMLRSSRWGGNRLELTDIAPGQYTLFLYVWEDNNAETYSIDLNGRRVLTNYHSGTMGHWERLGPWQIQVGSDSRIVLTSLGGAANWSGVEIWTGHYDGLGDVLDDEQLAFFEKRIRPLLVNHCYECHSAESDDLAGELLVDSRATLRRGGTNGPAVVPGDLEKSLLLKAVRYEDESLQMPPDGKLSGDEIRDLEKWVLMGAPDPRSTGTKHLGKQIDIAAAREFWSFKPISDPEVPAVENAEWPVNDIDRFVLAKQVEHGLHPTADADRRTLIRRLTYDLTGLPPTPEETAAFLANASPEAYERVVDRLLESPRYGERWGRHWLDVVRYADTAGDNSDYPVPQIYRYRDWVIDAFNRDLPYDDFVRDQLAGDLLGGANVDERNERIIATGYLANARRFGSRVDDYPWHLTIEDTIDNLGKTFLGLSLGCTRCHDHKFDPLTTRDYYGLYGIFNSTRYPWPGIELDKKQREFVPLVDPEKRVELEQAQAERTKEQARLDGEVKKLRDALKKTSDEQKKTVEEKLREAEKRALKHRQQSPLYETAYAVIDAATRSDVAVQLKGDPTRLGDVVPRHFPAVLGGGELPADCDASGRLELAEWIVSPENPLPARVLVNRLWQHHFSRGIVNTPNDFGKQGKPPTHPELLDWLAVRFRESGWSIKTMQRLIVLSRTYRQSSLRDSHATNVDPANDWLAGYPRHRLDAEAIRDTLLVLAGDLDLSPPGSHPFPEPHAWDFTQHKPFKALYETNHRSVYLMTQRIQRHPFLAIFDGADPSTSTAARMTSTTPLQALYLLNDPFVHAQSQRISQRIQSYATAETDRIRYACELIFTRPPSDAEIDDAHTFLHEAQMVLQQSGQNEESARTLAWDAYLRTLLRLNAFIYID